MNENQEYILVNSIESIAIDLKRIAEALAPASTTLSAKENRYNIYYRSSGDKFYCDCRHDEFRHNLMGFECHRCLKFYSMEDYFLYGYI